MESERFKKLKRKFQKEIELGRMTKVQVDKILKKLPNEQKNSKDS